MTDEHGLTTKEVADRVVAGEQNIGAPDLTRSTSRIFRDNLLTWFNLINVVLAFFVVLTGSYKNLLFLGVVVVNIVIGIFQEIRSKRQIDKIALLSEGKVTVHRDGQDVAINQHEIVQDDLLVVTRGDQMPVDGVIIATRGVEVDESQITGEPNPIRKMAGDKVTSASVILSGAATVQVTAVGDQTFVSQISSQVKQESRSTSELLNTINRIIKVLTVVIIPLGVALFAVKLIFGHTTFNHAILGSTAAMVGMIPEGLVLLTSVALAVSAATLARKRVLVRKLPAIEALARVDMIALDKTGTITSGQLQFEKVIPLAGTQQADLEQLIGNTVHAIGDKNETATAMLNAFPAATVTATDVVPFSSARKWSGATFADFGHVVIGATEFILKTVPTDLQKRVDTESGKGNRVLLIAHADEMSLDGVSGVQPLGLILISDELRPNAESTFGYFLKQDVDLKVISGDNPVTVASIAKRAGIFGTEHHVDMSVQGEQADFDQLVAENNIFGRVTPTQKKSLIEAYQRAGHTVAMTGDGVNDTLALRQSDCGIAMASGSEATKSIADFVLVDSNFDAMIDVLKEGRRVINNIENVAALYLIKTIYSIILSVLFLFVAEGYPFEPIQLTPISSLTVGIPSFFLALEPNYHRVVGRFMQQVLEIAAPAALCVVGYILGIVGIGVELNWNYSTTSTLSVLLTGAVGICALLLVARPLNRLKFMLVASMAVLFVGVFIFFPGIFSLVSIWNLNLEIIYVPLLISVYPVYQLVQNVLGNRILSRIKWR